MYYVKVVGLNISFIKYFMLNFNINLVNLSKHLINIISFSLKTFTVVIIKVCSIKFKLKFFTRSLFLLN